MDERQLRRNYSESDINKLINNEEKKSAYINRIIDSDIYLNMVSESNTPIKERSKFFMNKYRKNNLNNFNESNERYGVINNIKSQHFQKKNLFESFGNDNIINNHNFNYDNKYVNNNISIDINKPFHRERRHFPLVNNKGNFFRNMTPFLIENTDRLKNRKEQNYNYNNRYIDYDKYNRYNEKIYMPRDNSYIRKYEDQKLGRSNSTLNNQAKRYTSLRDQLIRGSNNNIEKEYIERSQFPMSKYLMDRESKFYNPYRYDYNGSRYGDKTYNYYLNAPMRSDISKDWRYPPLYLYNSQNV